MSRKISLDSYLCKPRMPAIRPIEPLADARGSPGVQPPARFFHGPPVLADD
jgi:hypothetical protein